MENRNAASAVYAVSSVHQQSCVLVVVKSPPFPSLQGVERVSASDRRLAQQLVSCNIVRPYLGRVRSPLSLCCRRDIRQRVLNLGIWLGTAFKEGKVYSGDPTVGSKTEQGLLRWTSPGVCVAGSLPWSLPAL